MKPKLLLALIFAMIISVGCAEKQQPVPPSHAPETETKTVETTEDISETVETQPETAAETLPSDPNVVSSLAEKDYLEPFLDYSWEREFDVEYVVLHFTSNVVNDRSAPYDMEKVKAIMEKDKVSAHYVIDRDGSIRCFIPENYAAWHAGAGTFANDEKYTNKMNKYSIGIEMLSIGSYSDMQYYLTYSEYSSLDETLIGFTDSQYEALKNLLTDICQRHSIPFDREHVIGHDEYNPKKNDPGDLFQWDRLFG